MKKILLQLNKNEINLIKEISTTWFNMENFNNEWLNNWEAAVKIYYRCSEWSEEKLIEVEEDVLDGFKDCIQDYVFQGFENDIGFLKFNIGKFLFIKILEVLQIDYPPSLFIPLAYESRDYRKPIKVDPTKNPLIELAKHDIYINPSNQN